ncbi:hypothetical protein FRX31_017514 [Thalictrum thalictroides]|uniref:Uncharacterized protein n=1 Tax=Thalictrum thalictroides TaxID=46969 RepID=A0A7J6W7V1_THATH|nr:hypothetical protein FRX31_017514 [Thalictrum thalictroides]
MLKITKSRYRIVEEMEELRENSRHNREFIEKQRIDALQIAEARDTRAKERNDNERQPLAMLHEDRDRVIMNTEEPEFHWDPNNND